MTIFQCLLIALFGYMSSIYSPWLAMGGWYTMGRPLVAGMVIGAILGDVRQGIILGSAIQMLYIGLVTPGGSMPADVNYVAWIGIPLAMMAGVETEVAVVLSVPLSFIGVLAVLFTITFNSVFITMQDRLIGQGKLKEAIRIPVIGQITNFVVRFFPIFICNYLGGQFVQNLAGMIPIAVLGVLNSFGNLLPLIGFAILLKYVCKSSINLIYYLAGFALVAALKLPILVVLVFATLLAFIDYSVTDREKTVPVVNDKEADIKEIKRLLDKKDVFSCYRSWLVWNLSVQNMERMEGPAIIRMLGMVKDRLYPDNPSKQKELLERHTPFFNTEPYLGCIVPGIILGMEEENARSAEGVPDELIIGIKTALMGPLAGIGDSLYVGTLIPILLAVGIGISGTNGSVAGPLLYVIAHLGIMIPLTWTLFNRGYLAGLNAASSILEGGIKDRITRAMNIVGLTIVGAITAEYVHAAFNLVMKQGDEVMLDVSSALNGVFPNFITLGLALFVYWLMAKKNVKVGWMYLIIFGLAVVLLIPEILGMTG